MIDGVQLRSITVHADDRGYFAELLRDDDGLLSKFGQASITKTFCGVIKAFHWHKHQDDLWFVAQGNVQVVLYDLREDSPTAKQTQVIYLGEHDKQLLLIPKGVAHGYRVLGTQDVTLIYFTTASYNPDAPDEERIPFDDPAIGFDWSTKNR